MNPLCKQEVTGSIPVGSTEEVPANRAIRQFAVHDVWLSGWESRRWKRYGSVVSSPASTTRPAIVALVRSNRSSASRTRGLRFFESESDQHGARLHGRTATTSGRMPPRLGRVRRALRQSPNRPDEARCSRSRRPVPEYVATTTSSSPNARGEAIVGDPDQRDLWRSASGPRRAAR
jgi:hypothetical protein